MVLRDHGLYAKEIMDYTRNVEPLSLNVTIPEYPAQPENPVPLLIPELDNEGRVLNPHPTLSAKRMSVMWPYRLHGSYVGF